MRGPVALAGSGEYLPEMLEVERGLITGRPGRYVQIPTAAAPEGPDRLAYWVRLGLEQAERLGVTGVPLVVRDRQDAEDPQIADQVAGAGLVYLSGGDPRYLAATLRDTLVWAAVLAAWEQGAALAGCSAGAMALAGWVPDLRHPRGATPADGTGLGVVSRLRVIPHFGRMGRFLPDRIADLTAGTALRPPTGTLLVGIEEDTALVGGPDRFTVEGRGAGWILGRGTRFRLGPGRVLDLTDPPTG